MRFQARTCYLRWTEQQLFAIGPRNGTNERLACLHFPFGKLYYPQKHVVTRTQCAVKFSTRLGVLAYPYYLCHAVGG